MSDDSKGSLFPATVVRVLDDSTIVINRGKDHGVEKGSDFLLYFVDEEEIFDPESGESLGRLEVVRGTGTVIHVQPKMATIKSNRTVSKGRVIRRISNPGTLRALGLMGVLGGESETIEQPEREPIPFESPAVGDKAKPI